jgi:hypothetical protein
MCSSWKWAFVWALGKLNGLVMRIFTGSLSWWCGLTHKLFKCPGFRIVRQYKNDGYKENYVPHVYYLQRDLVTVEETTHTIFNTENIVVHGVNRIIGIVTVIHDTSGVKSAEVEGASGLKLTSF